MGCGGSKEQTAESKHNAEVDRQLIEDEITNLFNFKLLLLGAGESGKSTILKQIRLIHNKKPNDHELRAVAEGLHMNVVMCMTALIAAAKKFGYELTDEERKTADAIQEWDDNKAEGSRIDHDMGQAILKLYNGDAIQKAFGRRDEFWILDACSYYLKHLERFTHITFKPSDEDVVMARVRTTGIHTSHLEQKRADAPADEPQVVRFEVVDVGGQRNERKKWIHCFDNCQAILFVVSLAGYNQVMFEDANRNRMEEAMDLFRQVVQNPVFKATPIFLFLNKKDLFEKMIQEKDLSSLFPEYQGGPDVLQSINFISEKFRSQVDGRQAVNIQAVTGVARKDIQYAFQDVKKNLIDTNAAAVSAQKQKLQKLLNK